MTGTRAMSGSEPTRLRNSVMTFSDSSIPSSILMSMMLAPPSICCLAIESAASRSPALMSWANFGEPVTLVRSPTMMKFESRVMVNASKPLSRRCGSGLASARGGRPATASAMARMCSGRVPQHPPTILSQPFDANSRTTAAIDSGVSSYSPRAFGRPAFG